MYVFAVVSPDAFHPDCFDRPGYQDQAALFFRGVESNGVLLVDANAKLLDDIDNAVSSLAIKFRQDLEIRVAELRKGLREKRKRRRIVKCRADICRTATTQSPLLRCTRICQATGADALFVSDVLMEDSRLQQENLPCISMAEYSRSDFEERRRWYMEDLPPIDQIDSGEFEDLVVRSTRFSVWLRFFDKQVGKGRNLSNFRRGIERIIRIWIENAHFRPDAVEIVTAEAEPLTGRQDDYTAQKKRERNQEASAKVRRMLLEPLQNKFPVRFHLRIKRDTEGVFHARHLQSQTAYVLFDRGFDIEHDDKRLRRNIIKVDNGAQEHLNECRNLPDAVLSTFAS